MVKFLFLSKSCETLSPNSFLCSRRSLTPSRGRETVLEVLMDAPPKISSKSRLCAWGFCSRVMWHKEWPVRGPRSPYLMHDMLCLPFNHKTCRCAPLSRSGLFIGTQKICALLWIQTAALGYDPPVPCPCVLTQTSTAISTSRLCIWTRAGEGKVTLTQTVQGP